MNMFRCRNGYDLTVCSLAEECGRNAKDRVKLRNIALSNYTDSFAVNKELATGVANTAARCL